MKKALFLMILASLLAACAPETACLQPCEGSPGTQAVSREATGSGSDKVWTYPDMVVGFLSAGQDGGWLTANAADMKDTAKALGITLKFRDAQSKVEDQHAAFRRFIDEKDVNVIVLDPMERIDWENDLRDAQAAGKVVIIEDRRVTAPEELYATYIGSDFAEQGRKAAAEMCALLGETDGKKVWELAGTDGSSVAIDRGRGFREEMDSCGIEVVHTKAANWIRSEGGQVTQTWLAESRDVQGIFAQSDEMALGAIEALKAAGLRPGVDVKIVSIDAASPAFDAMLEGELNAAVECNPLLATQIYEAALAALNGQTLPKWIPSQEGVFRAGMPGLEAIAAGRKY